MITVRATEFSKNFGKYRDMAQREPVAVTNHDRITGYFISPVEYEEYARMRARLPKAYKTEELPKEWLDALAQSKMDPRHDHLNKLLDKDEPSS